MTAKEVMSKFQSKGHRLWYAKGAKGGLRCNPMITPELKRLLEPVREEIIDLLIEEQVSTQRRRYGKVPKQEELEPQTYSSPVTRETLALVGSHVLGQGEIARFWCMRRSLMYQHSGMELSESELTAAFDLVIWQRGDLLKEQNRRAKEREFVAWLKRLNQE